MNELNLCSTTSSLLQKAIAETRSISHNLMPNELKEFGLGCALLELVNNINETGQGYKIVFDNQVSDEEYIDPKIAITFYRVIQEIINNSIKHANANLLRIVIGIRNKHIYLITKDDGVGFEVEKSRKSGLGLGSLENRAKSTFGRLKIRSQRGKGTTHIMKVPLAINKIGMN
ncbi:MAG: hypothetical protein JKY42_03120 [Flavobacteriales bacterium]|nr:hypothetical protein [Flavobacteriales bacterium]